MEILKLIGVLVVIVGLALKLDTLATVVVAGIITGFVAGMSPLDILTVLGNAFISQRISTLFVLALPAIGICERYGLKDKAVDLIKKIANATTGRILSLYLAIRVFAAATSLRIGGHCAGVENFGNFFGQNCFLGASGTLLIVSTLTEQGVNVMKDGNPVPVDVLGIAMWSIPIAIVSVILGIIYFVIYDRKLEKALGGK